VTHETRERPTGADLLAFLKRIARAYPKAEVHLILDHVATHKTPAVQAWLARHKRFVFHFTPTSASWMNQLETCLSILTRAAIRRGSFGSVADLERAIDAFTSAWNDQAEPFAWVKTADQILAKAITKG
jgi:transposase